MKDLTPTIHRAAAMPSGTPEVAVAIVGAGACGLTAALALREAGIECVLLERDASPQGSTALSSGFIPAAGTAVQSAAGVADSAELFAQDIQHKARDTAAPHLVQAYAQASAAAIDLLARHGLEFELLDGFLYPGHSVRRMHTLRSRTGAALVSALAQAAQDAGAMLVSSAQVHELWCDQAGAPAGPLPDRPNAAPSDLLIGGSQSQSQPTPQSRVLGLGFRRPNGQVEHLSCRAVLLACNGYGGDRALLRQWLPEMREAVFAGHTGNDGSAVRWAHALGLRVADLGGYQGHGSWAVPQGVLITWALMMEGGVQINARGRRFHDETQGYSEAAVQVLAQPGGLAWNVFDQRLLALARSFPDFVQAEGAGALRHAADTTALAALIGCDEPTLRATLVGTKLQAPYCAVQVTGALFHTQGGLDIDARCRALWADGHAHPNLLAAGGAARGVSGNAVWGYLSGNGLLSAVAGGHIAAHTIQELLAC
jgi:fumarate reductase flavoprotein subunit